MDLKIHIGLKVKSARQQKMLTQEGLAEAIGKAVETVSNIERGHALTGLDTLQKIAKIVDQPLGFFFQDSDDERRISRKRLEIEEQLQLLGRTLEDDGLSLAVALLETIVRRQRR